MLVWVDIIQMIYKKILNKKNIVFCIPLIGFLISWIAFYPGFMSYDSLMQYDMSKTLIFNDSNPPIMAWVWSILNIFFIGPEGLLFFHLLLLWFGLYFFYRYNKKNNDKYPWLIFIVGFLPWVINFSGVLWKDVGMAYSFLLFIALSLGSFNLLRFCFALIILFYTINVRYNSIFAAIPVLYFIFRYWFQGISRIKTIALVFAMVFFSLGLGNIFNYKFLNSEKFHPQNYMMVDDLFYFSLKNKTSLIPGILFQDIQKCSTYEIGQNMLVGRMFCLSDKNSISTNKLLHTDLKSIWLTQVLHQPIDYIRYRLASFLYLLRSPNVEPYYIWHSGIDKNPIGLKQERNRITIFIEWLVYKTAQIFPFLFKPYFWLCFSTILLIVTNFNKKNENNWISQMLLTSSIFYILGYFPSTPMADFRYIYWSVIASSLATVLVFTGQQ